MRLLTFMRAGTTRLGTLVGDRVYDLAAAYDAIPLRDRLGPPTLPSDMLAFLWGGELAMAGARQVEAAAKRAQAAGTTLAGAAGQRIDFARDDVKVAAPIARPGKIICLGLNYADHARETGHKLPPAPILWGKYANSVCGPGDPIVLPRASEGVDYEVEFAAVIGKVAKHVSLDSALEYVAGYTMLNDVSARDLQSETSQWFRGKSPDTFAPMGPYLVTSEEIPYPHELDVRLWLNGELMQSSNTRELIFDVPFLVHHISKTVTLEPGDVISTGTPSGVGMARDPRVWLKPGDTVRLEVGALGVLENPVVAEG